jgi:alkylated DNA repair dioxygenase AlkB
METVVPGFLDIDKRFLSRAEATRLFEQCAAFPIVENAADLRPGVPALVNRPPITVYGKECRQQRHVAFFAAEGVRPYRYSGQDATRQDMPDWISDIMAKVSAKVGANFNAVLLNYYPDGKFYISDHQDSETGLTTNAPVAALSLGAVRNFRIKAYPSKTKVKDVPLGHGSLVVMHNQRSYTHGIPPESKVRDGRFSLTFRVHRA